MNGINKQLALLDGIPVVIRSALAFENSAQAGEIILAVPAGEEERYAALCSQYGITKLKAAVHGGATRFLSVKNDARVRIRRIRVHRDTRRSAPADIHCGYRPRAD